MIFTHKDNCKVVVGYSGGRDSTTLLHLLSKKDVFPIYCNHKWEKDIDPPLPCEIIHADRPVVTESSAREWRYKVLLEVCRKKGGNTVLAVGHTASDRVETMLYNLARGSSLRGLCTPKEVSYREGVKIIRPLLKWSREETKQYCLDHSLPYIDDPYNASIKSKRVFIRNKIIPHLKELHKGAISRMALTSEELEEDNDFMETLAQKEFLSRLDLNRLDLSGLHIAIKRRIIRVFLKTISNSNPTRKTITKVLSNQKTQVKGGFTIVWEGQTIIYYL